MVLTDKGDSSRPGDGEPLPVATGLREQRSEALRWPRIGGGPLKAGLRVGY